MSTLPSWAVAQTYEYDLDMSTVCEHCGKDLAEGATVYKDTESRNTYYCSEQCVQIADEGAPPPDCHWCGEPSDMLTEVDDSDPSTGYHSTMMVCPACQTRRRLQRYDPYNPALGVTSLAPGDEADEPWTDFGDELDAQDAGLRAAKERQP